MSRENSEWTEENHQDILCTKYKKEKVLFSEKSDFQQIEIIQTAGHGKMLFNDNIAMISERDEFVYHEMISHVALFTNPEIENVLVIGGGDGGTVREVLKHQSVKKCTLVEIDESVVRACKEHIPLTSACLDDPRANVLIDDGVKFVANTKEVFDLIIIDSTDPVGPGASLFGKDFYQNVYKILTEKGIVISQAESPFYELEMQKNILGILNSLFETVCIYNYSNLTYPGGIWSLSFASKGLHPLKNFQEELVNELALATKYYNSEVHKASFVLPQFMKEELKELIAQ